jgi:hypothetical protein
VLHDELQYFIDHQEELLKRYSGKVLVIKGQKVVGAYDTQLEAYIRAQQDHELGTFLIQPCRPGPEAYTVTLSPHAVVL